MNRTRLLALAPALLLFAAAHAQAQEGEAATAVAPTGETSNVAVAPGGEGEAHPAGEAAEEVEAPEHAPSHLVLGAVGTGLVTTTFGDTLDVNSAFGGGIFAEYTIVPNWLAIELDVRLMGAIEMGEVHGELPIDLLVKKPFELSETLEAYIGIGGTLVPILVSGASPNPNGGLAAVVGGYYWLSTHFAITAELDYNLLLGGSNLVQEVGISAGVALGI